MTTRAKQTFSLILTLALWLTTTATAWAAYSGGTGTKDDPYLIANANDLNKLAHHLNYQSTGYFDDKYFVQTADIDCSGWTYYDTWEVIGKDADHPFGGHYDGGGYSITGFTITTDGQYAGLFGYIKGGPYNGSEANTKIAEVHGVVLVNPTITVTANSNDQYAGAVVGYAGDCARAYDNTVIGGTVTFTGGSNYNTNNSYAGGLIGYFSNSNFPKLSGNKVSGTTVSGGGVCGGLVGFHISYSTQLSGNFADANVSSVEFDLHQDQHTYGYRQGALAGYCNIISGGVTSVNYYHSRNGLTAYGNKTEWHAISAEPDNSWVAPLYTVAAPDGLTVSGTPTVSLNGTDYYAANATVTLTTDADHIISGTPTVSGTGASLGSVATDRKSMTLTIGTADATVSATLVAISGTCSLSSEYDNCSWRVSDENGDGTYETLTISGTGRLNYSENGTAPWYADFHSTITNLIIGDGIEMIQTSNFYGLTGITEVNLPATVYFIAENAFEGCTSLARVNILKSDGVVTLYASNAFSGCAALQTIVVPTPALAVEYSTAANWSDYASKLRVALGNYLFTATDEGGTAAYAIASEADLRNLAAAVNATNNISSGKTFRQTADITMTGGNFPRIGIGGDKSFMGTYDGQGHAISGLSVSITYGNIGLFSVIKGATVRNVLLVSPTATATTTSSIYSVNLGALIGQCGSGGTNTVENCVVVSPTVSSSSTGSDNYVGAIIGMIWGATNVTNCYYYDNDHDYATVGWYDSDGHLTNVARARRITLGSGVTAVSPAATAPANGFQYDGSDYYREGLALTLTTTAGATVPDGYTQTVSANGTALSGTTYTVNATDGDATLTASVRSDGQQHEVSYVEADGTEHHVTATFLDGYEPVTSQYGSQYINLAAGWYFVGADIDYTGKCIRPQGAVNLILGNGKTMHIGTADNPTGYSGIEAVQNLTIYGQSLDNATAGTLSYVGTGGYGIDVSNYTQHSGNVSISNNPFTGRGIDASSVTIKGGSVTVATNSNDARAIYASGNITISGGTVDAHATGSGDLCGIMAGGTITLSCTNATDRITASSYSGTISVADDQALYDGDGNILSGDLTASAINGKTLQPAAAAVAFAPEGYATYYNGKNDITLPAGVKARIVTANDGAALTYATIADGDTDNKVVPAGTAIMLQTAASNETQTKALTLKTKSNATISGTNLLHGSDVEGTTTGDGKHYKLSYNTSGTDLGWYWGTADGAPFATTAHKAWLVLPNGSNARFFGLPDFGETTSLIENVKLIMDNEAGAWYTLDGRKLSGKPAKGVYIVNGRKIVVK